MSKDIKRNDRMHAYWMPFTPNKEFKENPRILESAEGLYFTAEGGHRVIDGSSGLWCSALGHNHPKVTVAIREQAGKLDYSTAFNFAHSDAFELAIVIADTMPGDLNHVFFTNSGAEANAQAIRLFCEPIDRQAQISAAVRSSGSL